MAQEEIEKVEMNDSGFCLAYITCPDQDTALKLGQEMVDRGLAACANILPEMKSVYMWEGEAEVTREAILILKTTEKRYSQLEDAVVAAHTYEVPCVLKLPISAGSPKYLSWIMSSLTRTEPGPT